MKRFLITGFAFLITFLNQSIAQPALPEEGYRWVLNDELSDEFDGATLNTDVWQNTDTRWIGRPPGLFMFEAVSLDDGKMRITTDKLSAPEEINGNTFTHQGGHVRSVNKVKPGSYVECKMKANKTFMSSTFWMINYSNESTGCQKRTTELDIQECIGYPENKTQTQRMGSNTHSRGIPETCTDIVAGSVGNHIDTPGKVYDNYYTYGVWWKGPSELLFYLNGEYVYTITPKADFDIDMYIKLVVETYNWNPVPEDGGMTGTWEERTTFYDWVRTYTYLPMDKEGQSSNKIFNNNIQFTDKPGSLPADELSFILNYQSNENAKIVLELKDDEGVVVERTEKEVYSGFGNTALSLEEAEKGGSYTVVASLYDEFGETLLAASEHQMQIIGNVTSLADDSLQTLKIIPNPVNRSISLAGLHDSTEFEIHSITGSVVLAGVVKNTDYEIDVSILPEATYILKLKTLVGHKSIKFVKG